MSDEKKAFANIFCQGEIGRVGTFRQFLESCKLRNLQERAKYIRTDSCDNGRFSRLCVVWEFEVENSLEERLIPVIDEWLETEPFTDEFPFMVYATATFAGGGTPWEAEETGSSGKRIKVKHDGTYLETYMAGFSGPQHPGFHRAFHVHEPSLAWSSKKKGGEKTGQQEDEISDLMKNAGLFMKSGIQKMMETEHQDVFTCTFQDQEKDKIRNHSFTRVVAESGIAFLTNGEGRVYAAPQGNPDGLDYLPFMDDHDVKRVIKQRQYIYDKRTLLDYMGEAISYSSGKSQYRSSVLHPSTLTNDNRPPKIKR